MSDIIVKLECLLDDMRFADSFLALCDLVHEEHFAAYDVSLHLEELSLMVNDVHGHHLQYKEVSRQLKQLAQDLQLMPARVPYDERPRRPRVGWR